MKRLVCLAVALAFAGMAVAQTAPATKPVYTIEALRYATVP